MRKTPVVLVPVRNVRQSYSKKQAPVKRAPHHPSIEGVGVPGLGSGGLNSTHQDIEDVLMKLTKAERDALINSVLAKDLLQVDQSREVDLWSQAVYEALVESLGGVAVVDYGPAIIKRLMASRSTWQPVQRLASAIGLLDMKPGDLLQAFKLLADLLVDYARAAARKSKVPMTPKLVASCAVNIVPVFESNFPGYLQSGLAMIPFRANQRRSLVAA